jgi:ParB family chromosome partitioning protein
MRKVPIGDLRPGRFQPRTKFDEEDIASLADSLRRKGMLQPILARPVLAGADGDLEIVAGERRWRAAQQASLHEVPVLVREFSDVEVVEIALVENLQRTDLNPLEEAAAFKRLQDEFGFNQAEIGEAVGKSRSHIANTMRLMELPSEVQTMLEDGRLTAGHARALLGSDNAIALAHTVIDRGLSVRDTEALVKQESQPPSGSAAGRAAAKAGGDEKDADTKDLENRLAERLGLKVDINGRGEKGRVVLHYTDLEQLDDIIAKLEAPTRPRLVGS